MKASISKSKTRNKPTNSSLQISHRVKAFQKNVKNKQHCLVGGFLGGVVNNLNRSIGDYVNKL